LGTAGTVKAVHQRELMQDLEAQIILGNTYHLYLRPGLNTIEQAAACTNLMAGIKPILTDSGGYQVYFANRSTEDKGGRRNLPIAYRWVETFVYA